MQNTQVNFMNICQIHHDSGIEIGGVSLINVPKDHHYGWVCTKGSFTSDEVHFYRIIDDITKLLFKNTIINLEHVSNFFAAMHKDTSADVYFGDLPMEIEIRSKKPIEKGEIIFDKDIADIRRLRFPTIKLIETDKILVCMKVKWKFGLYFDFIHESKLDIEELSYSLGTLYRRLRYDYIYKIIENHGLFDMLKKRGWFPFIELIGNELKVLSERLEDNFNIAETLNDLVKSFNRDRIEKMSQKWWEKEVFLSKKPIIQAGLDSFFEDNEKGYINCIKNLITEIEGVIRMFCSKKGEKSTDIIKLLEFIINESNYSLNFNSSLLLPNPFLEYLKNVIFRGFNVEKSDIPLSRPSTAHGVAKPEDYTRERALQTILCLDQIYYYLKN
ncbi:MAG: hypothetical protein HQ591_06925 [candidate division Zixibacteria bacterium]|nr:hypothetical protein [Candidatus Tariuqbacter arcticus]